MVLTMVKSAVRIVTVVLTVAKTAHSECDDSGADDGKAANSGCGDSGDDDGEVSSVCGDSAADNGNGST